MTEENTPPPPPSSDDPTPEERKRWAKYLDEFLAEDETKEKPPPATTTQPAATTSSIDVEAAVSRALDARESKSQDAQWKAGIEGKIAQLSEPKKRKWYEPWTLFSGLI